MLYKHIQTCSSLKPTFHRNFPYRPFSHNLHSQHKNFPPCLMHWLLVTLSRSPVIPFCQLCHMFFSNPYSTGITVSPFHILSHLAVTGKKSDLRTPYPVRHCTVWLQSSTWSHLYILWRDILKRRGEKKIITQ